VEEHHVSHRKILGAILLSFVLVFALACGDDDDGGSNSPTAVVTDEVDVGGATATSEIPPAPEYTKTTGELILATTTSTQDSGLLDALVPMFEDETGYTVKTVAVGSGQAIEQGSRGDADLVLVHSPAAEQEMVDAGDGIERTLVMHNDFIIVGPEADPAGLTAEETLDDVMRKIADADAPFISRGDDSGTHALEKKLWANAGVDPAGQPWYEESGQGMGATLQITNQKQAYTLSDRGTFLSQAENLDLGVAFEGAPGLLNVYHVIVVNPEKHSDVNVTAARAFAAFITRADVQALIGEFGVDKFGQPLFFPDAGKPDPTT
jgi:tungstate transport system substrate-binding protein